MEITYLTAARRPATLAYLAGLLEGEATFMLPPPSAPGSVSVTLSMTDEDVVAKAALLLETTYWRTSRRHERHKDAYTFRVKAQRGAELMAAVRPWMGARRGARIDQALAARAPAARRVPYATEVSDMASMKTAGARRAEIGQKFGVKPHSVNAYLRGDFRPLGEVERRAAEVRAAEGFLSGVDPDRAWFAGLLEGEGSFVRGVRVEMTDEDVIRRAANMLGAKRIVCRPARREGWSPTWIAEVGSDRGRALAAEIRPLLGARRQGQVDAFVCPQAASGTGRGPRVPADRLARNLEIARRVAAGEPGPALAQEYGMTHQNVYYIVRAYRSKVVCPSG